MNQRTRLVSLALATCGVLIARSARAHTGPAIARNITFTQPPGMSQVESIEDTYGLIQQDTSGEWRLLCADAPLGDPYPKTYKIWTDGQIVQESPLGIRYTTDGCNFATPTGDIDPNATVGSMATADLSASGGPTLLVVSTQMTGSTGTAQSVFVSSDEGHSFTRITTPDGLNVLSMTVLQGPAPVIVLTAEDAPASGTPSVDGGSPDGGAADGGGIDGGDAPVNRWVLTSSTCLTQPHCSSSDWQQIKLDPSLFGDGDPRVLAAFADEGIFVESATSTNHLLFRSTDGGQTFTQVLPASSGAPLTSPAFFLDRVGANDLWTAYGYQLAFHSTDGGKTWQPRPDLGDIRCVRSDGAKLHFCIYNLAENVVTGVSTDNGATVTPDLLYSQVKGVRQCSASSDVTSICQPLWFLVQLAFQGQQSPQPANQPPSKSGCSCCATTEVGVVGLLALGLLRRRRRRNP